MVELRLHQPVRPAVQRFRLQRRPVQATEQRQVLRLHVGKEGVTASRVRAGHRETDQRGAEPAVAAEGRMHREARTPPQAGVARAVLVEFCVYR